MSSKKNLGSGDSGVDIIEKFTTLVVIATLVVSIFNMTQLAEVKDKHAEHLGNLIAKGDTGISSSSNKAGNNNAGKSQVSEMQSKIMPKGMPDLYGKELGVTFDDVSSANPKKADTTISKLAALDRSISLVGDDLQRYISIAGSISCEYCCGADSIIFKNGEPACGCAHSYAMRGLAKYLITKHGSEYTDDQILDEMGKWKTLFFPGPMAAKAEILAQKGIELNYVNLASNKYRGIEKSASATGNSGGSMVGGC